MAIWVTTYALAVDGMVGLTISRPETNSGRALSQFKRQIVSLNVSNHTPIVQY